MSSRKKEKEMEGFSGPHALNGRRAAILRRIAAASVVALAGLLALAAGAWGATGTEPTGASLCMPKSEGAAVLTPRHGNCRKGYTLTRLGVEGKEGKQGAAGAAGKAGAEGKQGAEGKAGTEGKTGPEGPEGKPGEAGSGLTAEQLSQLKALLPHMTLIASGIDGKPTIRFSGVNVQIVNGEGKTATANGEGNLVIGYDENPAKHAQTGSHDLILGEEQTFTSYGGIDAGFDNAISGGFASIVGGGSNSASFKEAAIGGGWANVASNENAFVAGGYDNTASSKYATAIGGKDNVSGQENTLVSGGFKNAATAPYASVSGGKELTASKEYEAAP
jgi:hypothetical protein